MTGFALGIMLDIGKTQLINNANKTKTKHAYDKRHHPLSGTYSERPYSSNAVQEATLILLYEFGSWFGSSTVLASIEIFTISSLVEKQSW